MRAGLALLACVAGCATASTIHTVPEGAQVYINGKRCAGSPCIYHSRYGFPERMRVQVYKPGYRPTELFVDTEAPLISYALFGVGSYLFHTFEKEYRFELVPLEQLAQQPGAPATEQLTPGSWPGDGAAGNAIEQCIYWHRLPDVAPADRRFVERARKEDCARAQQLAALAAVRETVSPALAAALIRYDGLLAEGGRPLVVDDARLPAVCAAAVVELAKRLGADPSAEFPAFAARCPEQHRTLTTPGD